MTESIGLCNYNHDETNHNDNQTDYNYNNNDYSKLNRLLAALKMLTYLFADNIHSKTVIGCSNQKHINALQTTTTKPTTTTTVSKINNSRPCIYVLTCLFTDNTHSETISTVWIDNPLMLST